METQTQKCKRLIFNSGFVNGDPRTTVLFGIILDEKDNFITFKTAKTTYQINKNNVISIEETDMIFNEENGR